MPPPPGCRVPRGRLPPLPPVPGASAARAFQATTLAPADFADLGPCQVLPEQTEGAVHTDLDLMRRDITEGLPSNLWGWLTDWLTSIFTGQPRRCA